MLYIKSEGGYKGVYSRIPHKKGTALYSLMNGESVKIPTRTSIEITKNLHIEDEIGSCINHSCDPSCLIKDFFVVTLKDIEAGEEITFNYNESENVVSSPFRCSCCGKMILGRQYELLF
tara:strand:+ start:300 stop:656 length:357 start_codon:yes stop_codon:yes gene_type:complete